MPHPPTPEQQAIIDVARRPSTNIMVIAGAGCAKTTTMTMIANSIPTQPALALAFNVSIKKELERQFPSWFEVKTLNGLGHQAFGRAIGKRLEVDDRKLGKLVTEACRNAGFETNEDTWSGIRRLVAGAKQWGLVPSVFPHKSLATDRPEVWQELNDALFLDLPPVALDIARVVLIESVKLAFQGIIDYDDQIYMSVMFGGVFPRFPLVMVDEAQDLSPLNHMQIRKTAAGRLIVVGDPKQAIYAFRGADSESMARLRELRKDWHQLPLMQTFRCPKTVVTRQLDHAPGFRAAPANPEGLVRHWPGEDWTFAQLLAEIPPGGKGAILCRNNAPLLDIAFKLIRSGVGCVMLGREIGAGLKALAKKIIPDSTTPLEECLALVEAWAEQEQTLAKANGKENKLEAITDRAECLCAVFASGNITTAAGLHKALDQLFSRETGQITLATGHKAKGLEWDMVLHLDPWRVPSASAKAALGQGNPYPMQQEQNLRYVIETRTRHTLVLASLSDLVMEV